ncbi:hypothetical protein GCM10023168_33890 [Fodinibacter luteus]|uniref:DUF7144 domain-containing protein n=1 Tax=Fodinibacter luteus TaxID=552064 RepID=A0ABP8KPX6_9MICO
MQRLDRTEPAVSDLAKRQAILEGPKSTWAGGLTLFGGAMLVIVGILELLQGWSAIRKDDVFVAAPNYVYALDLTTWGWIHVLIGAAAIIVGAAIVKVRTWGLIAGIVIAAISLVSNFLFVPQSTWWAVVMVALSVALIWAFSEVISENRQLGQLGT